MGTELCYYPWCLLRSYSMSRCLPSWIKMIHLWSVLQCCVMCDVNVATKTSKKYVQYRTDHEPA